MAIKNGKKNTRTSSKGSRVLEAVKSKKGEKKNYTVKVDKEVGEKFRKYCEENNVSMSEMVEEFFRDELLKK